MSDKYVIGLDFGTQSGRGVLVRLSDGAEIAVSVSGYSRGVVTETLPNGPELPPGFALQHPEDYLGALEFIIKELLGKTGISESRIMGIGVAATSCTILPALKDGASLCSLKEYASDPHSWAKLWKHHGALQEAAELNQFLIENAPHLALQFGANSAERMLPKILEIKRHSPQVYEAAYTFVELADWIVWKLTGRLQRSAPIAGYKTLWRKETGYLDPKMLTVIDEDYRDIIKNKLPGPVIPMGLAGTISPAVSNKLGLDPATAVATGHIDAHAAVLGSGVAGPGTVVMVMGTSSCHLLLDERLGLAEGMSGAVKDGIVEGYYAYESGQSSVGDQFQWFVEQAVPGSYQNAAREAGKDIFGYLEEMAWQLPLGKTGLLALDWWRGNRSVLNNASLTGLIIGLTMETKPEEIYLALLESTAFGARRIIESFKERGLAVEQIRACGGLPKKNKLLAQIYADVMKCPIEIAASDYTSALGMAMWAGVAAGPEKGGYENIEAAVEKMAPQAVTTYYPCPERKLDYDSLYQEYRRLYDYFGRGGNKVMERLQARKLV
ncbi:MAG: ribulokinase [Firmicutes bacterium]|nr:ribulokinase [Bacillota bacterium]